MEFAIISRLLKPTFHFFASKTLCNDSSTHTHMTFFYRMVFFLQIILHLFSLPPAALFGKNQIRYFTIYYIHFTIYFVIDVYLYILCAPCVMNFFIIIIIIVRRRKKMKQEKNIRNFCTAKFAINKQCMERVNGNFSILFESFHHTLGMYMYNNIYSYIKLPFKIILKNKRIHSHAKKCQLLCEIMATKEEEAKSSLPTYCCSFGTHVIIFHFFYACVCWRLSFDQDLLFNLHSTSFVFICCISLFIPHFL